MPECSPLLMICAKEEAARLFRLAGAEGPGDFVEGPALGAELNALDKNP
jgi:hypothetical protein